MERHIVELRIPELDELDYRRKLLADRETMSYYIDTSPTIQDFSCRNIIKYKFKNASEAD